MGSYAWNATKPDAVIPCAISAVIFVASLPFYLMLKEPKKTSSDSERKPVIADA
jgi:hypothetical protein